MTRTIQSFAAMVALSLTLPSIASALSLSLVNVSGAGAGGTLLPGETVTFDLVLENDSLETVLGVGVFVDGYDTRPDIQGIHDGGLVFQSGQSATSVLDQVVPAVGTFTSLNNVHAAPFETFSVNNLRPETFRTIVFDAASLSGSSQDGQFDTGVEGNPILGGTGDVHFRLTYVSMPVGINAQNVTLNFGFDAIGTGGVVLPTTGASFNLTVIPEPGTALLMSLGLAGLAARRR